MDKQVSDKQQLQQQISRMMDGDLNEQELDALLQAMDADDLKTWDLYHQQAAGVRGEQEGHLSASFAARMAAQLAQEAPHKAGAVQHRAESTEPGILKSGLQWWQKKWMAIGAGVAALAAAMGLMAGPQVMLALGGADKEAPKVQLAGGAVQSSNRPVTLLASGPRAVAPSSSAPRASVQTRLTADGKEVEMLRDPEIDQYLQAHQRFSPSVYNTAQYARSATFASEQDK